MPRAFARTAVVMGSLRLVKMYSLTCRMNTEPLVPQRTSSTRRANSSTIRAFSPVRASRLSRSSAFCMKSSLREKAVSASSPPLIAARETKVAVQMIRFFSCRRALSAMLPARPSAGR